MKKKEILIDCWRANLIVGVIAGWIIAKVKLSQPLNLPKHYYLVFIVAFAAITCLGSAIRTTYWPLKYALIISLIDITIAILAIIIGGIVGKQNLFLATTPIMVITFLFIFAFVRAYN